MIAIRPPVLVPPIKSKYSQGFGVSEFDSPAISSIICRKMIKDDRPRTPPPSKVRIRRTLEEGFLTVASRSEQTEEPPELIV